ncbi:hypothetical protein J132_05747 [Termitomyces sp. J132]|nr:hypothetical protein J132_05747 [Termitomyces sp. J132]
MVINTDGTLSRIANWVNMTPEEQARTLRVLSARNKFVRLFANVIFAYLSYFLPGFALLINKKESRIQGFIVLIPAEELC